MEVLPRRCKRSLSSFWIIFSRKSKSSCSMAELGLSLSRGLSCKMVELSLVVSKLSKNVLLSPTSGRIERVVSNQVHNTSNAGMNFIHVKANAQRQTWASKFIGFKLKNTYWRGLFLCQALDFLIYHLLYRAAYVNVHKSFIRILFIAWYSWEPFLMLLCKAQSFYQCLYQWSFHKAKQHSMPISFFPNIIILSSISKTINVGRSLVS